MVSLPPSRVVKSLWLCWAFSSHIKTCHCNKSFDFLLKWVEGDKDSALAEEIADSLLEYLRLPASSNSVTVAITMVNRHTKDSDQEPAKQGGCLLELYVWRSL